MAPLNEDQRSNLISVELWNCRNAFEFLCPQYFSELQPTDDPEVRYCGVCRDRVYHCATPLDFATHGELGHCVAIPEGFAPGGALCTAPVGRPTRQDIEEQHRRGAAIRAWWMGVLAEQPQFAREAIAEVARILRQPVPRPPGS